MLRELIEEGKAYPCFLTAEELEVIRENQAKAKMRIGVYGKFAKYRDYPVKTLYHSAESENDKKSKSILYRSFYPLNHIEQKIDIQHYHIIIVNQQVVYGEVVKIKQELLILEIIMMKKYLSQFLN